MDAYSTSADRTDGKLQGLLNPISFSNPKSLPEKIIEAGRD
jgi:hypothetical protein